MSSLVLRSELDVSSTRLRLSADLLLWPPFLCRSPNTFHSSPPSTTSPSEVSTRTNTTLQTPTTSSFPTARRNEPVSTNVSAWDDNPHPLPTRPPSISDYLSTLTLVAPPPTEFSALLCKKIPHLARQGCEPTDSKSTYLPIPLTNLILHSRQRDYETFSFVCRLLNPTHLRIVSLGRRARTWHTNSVVIPSSWLLLQSIVMENCMVVRPEQGDMNSTISIPYQKCGELRRIRIEITKEDQPEPTDDEDIWAEENERIGILDSIWYNFPFLGNGEFKKLETFEVAVRGQERLDGLRRWMVERRHVLMDQWRDPERWERWFRLELLEGEVEMLPWSDQDSEKEERSEEEESEGEVTQSDEGSEDDIY